MRPGVQRVAGMYIILNKKGTFFFADCTVNVDPTPEELVGIIGLTAMCARFFEAEPRVARVVVLQPDPSKGEILKNKTRKHCQPVSQHGYRRGYSG